VKPKRKVVPGFYEVKSPEQKAADKRKGTIVAATILGLAAAKQEKTTTADKKVLARTNSKGRERI